MNHTKPRYSEQVLLSIFALLGIPKSMIDIGSGDGTMVRLARSMGVDAVGIDLSATEPDIRHDLTKYIDLNKKYEFALCLEVAEHITPGRGEFEFLHTIARHSMINGRLIWSSALPAQRGEGHVNCQSPIYWRSKLWEAGKFSFRPELTAKMSLILSHTAGPAAQWLPANVQVF